MYKNYSFVNGNNIETNKYGAPYQSVIENFSIDNRVIEYGFVSDSSSSSSSTNVDTKSVSTNETNVSNQTSNQTTNQTDNSVTSNTNVNSNTAIDSSQETTNVNTTDNSSEMNINSSTDTYNVDNSQVVNETISNVQNKMVQSCGMSIEEAQEAVNIVKDESINMNLDNSNTFINTGDNVTISDVRLESELDFVGPEVDRSCMLEQANELQAVIQAENENSKAFKGGEGGDVGAEAGGNTTSNENTTEKKDEVDGSMDASQDLTNAATTENTSENTTENTENENEQTSEQSTEASSAATASAGLAAGSASGSGISDYLLIGLVVLVLLHFLLQDPNMKLNLNFDLNQLNQLINEKSFICNNWSNYFCKLYFNLNNIFIYIIMLESFNLIILLITLIVSFTILFFKK